MHHTRVQVSHGAGHIQPNLQQLQQEGAGGPGSVQVGGAGEARRDALRGSLVATASAA